MAGIRIFAPDQLVMFDRMPHEIITVGRDRRRDICIRDDSVSRLHCIITPRPDSGTYQIHDCEAKNGVYVASLDHPDRYRRVDRHLLTHGMMVQLGDVILVPVDAHGEFPTICRWYARSRARVDVLVQLLLSIRRKTDDE